MLFGKNKLKDGDYAFVTQDYSGKIRLIIGRIREGDRKRDNTTHNII